LRKKIFAENWQKIAENWQKSPKIVITTSTPEFIVRVKLGLLENGERTRVGTLLRPPPYAYRTYSSGKKETHLVPSVQEADHFIVFL
jgi:hypothetical protein